MSDEGYEHTSVLLPAAQVTLFTKDGESLTAFEAIEKDWRFARVVMSVVEGDVEEAINRYGSVPSPDLILIQTDTIDDAFSGRLEALAENCAEGTAAIVIGPVNDVNLYRKLVNMGVTDYLVRPLESGKLANDIASALIEKVGLSDSVLVAMIGAKGGVGVSVLAEQLAWTLSEDKKQKTFLMDAAGGWSSFSVGMSFEPAGSLMEAVRAAEDNNEDSLSRMIEKPNDKLSVLSTGADAMLDPPVSDEGYEALIDWAMTTYPFVLVDLSQTPSDLRQTVISRAHTVLVTTTPTLTAVRAARTLLGEIKTLRGGEDDTIKVIVNMNGQSKKTEVSKVQIEEGLERKVDAFLPYEPTLFMDKESQAEKLYQDKTGRDIMDTLLPLFSGMLPGTDAKESAKDSDKGGLGGLLGALKRKA